MTGPTCLFDGRDVQLLHFAGDGAAAYRLVTFDIMHARANRKTAFAAALAVKNGVELYGIVPKHPCWYPGEETELACAIIARSAGPPALAYGSSMGGYGALRFGRLAGCQAVLAFSPQATIDPGVTGLADPRYARFHQPQRHRDMDVRADHLCRHTFVIHDPRSAFDSFQAGLLAGMAGLMTIALPHVGHKSVSVIASTDRAKAAFELALDGQGAQLQHLLRRSRSTAASYLAGLAQAAFDRGHHAWAGQIAARGLAKYPRDKDMTLVAALAAGKQGQPDRAAELLGRIIAGTPQVLKYRLALMQIRAEAGDYDGAVTALQGAMAQHHRFDLHIKLIRLLRQAKRWAEVQDCLTATLARWPDRAVELAKLRGRATTPA